MRNLLLSALILASALQTVFGEQSGDWTYSVSNNQATITAYTGAGGAVTIPSEVNGILVVTIGSNIFGYGNAVTSITIPNGVASIDNGAFDECRQLTSVSIPNSVRTIGWSAFEMCYNLHSVTLPEGLVSIGEMAFAKCAIREIYIPDSVQSIGSAAFAGYHINKISLPERLADYLPFIIGEKSNEDIVFGGVDEVVIRNRGNQYLYPGFLNQLANNTDFISALANNDAFVTAVANKIKGTVGTYGLATQSELGALATKSDLGPLATKSEITTAINEGRAAGIASVTASPNTWSLFTSSQIQSMAIGDLVLTREVNGNFVLNYDIEQSNDLANWTVYSANTQIVKLPADKAFVRIKAKQ